MVVNRPFQIRFIGRLVLFEVFTVLFTVLVAGFFTIYLFHRTLISRGVWGDTVMYYLLVLTAVLGLLALWRAVVQSHRIAGPLYRLEQAFTELAEGDLSVRVRIRRKDELLPFVRQFNTMLGFLSDRADQMADLTRELSDLADRRGDEQSASLLAELKEQLFETAKFRKELYSPTMGATLARPGAGPKETPDAP